MVEVTTAAQLLPAVREFLVQPRYAVARRSPVWRAQERVPFQLIVRRPEIRKG